MSDSKIDESDDSGPFDEWWGKLLGAPLCWGIAIWLFYQLGRLEVEGGSIRVNWFIAVAYKLGGRWGAVGLFAVLGTLFLVWGVMQFTASAKEKAKPLAKSPGAHDPEAEPERDQ